jgi:phi LC3 family holin
MINNLKMNIKNKAWWVAIISALIVLFKIWGIDLTDYIGKDWQNTVNAICTIAILLGISIDTTMQNLGGNNNESVSENAPSENNTTVTAPTEDTTLNNVVLDTKTLSDTKLEQIKTILNQ